MDQAISPHSCKGVSYIATYISCHRRKEICAELFPPSEIKQIMQVE